ncbi:hypothetical protein GCM10023156_12480 [Novipirellula rosea]|uniref:Uncharacterized protein n=1 Tax=Novipirellula rosea TaxID=1031540 RepID=A0ABP8MDL3_9BACT
MIDLIEEDSLIFQILATFGLINIAAENQTAPIPRCYRRAIAHCRRIDVAIAKTSKDHAAVIVTGSIRVIVAQQRRGVGVTQIDQTWRSQDLQYTIAAIDLNGATAHTDP